MPVDGDVTGVVDLCAGTAHACALGAGGTVSCWGDNYMYSSGVPLASQEVVSVSQVPGVSDAVAVTCASATSCAVLANGTMKCWGQGTSGQLGNGGISNTATPTNVLANAVGLVLDYVRVASAGNAYQCSIRANGAVSCWGSLGIFLGNGQIEKHLIADPINLVGCLRAQSLGLAGAHACVVASDGFPQCWGRKREGELGNDDERGGLGPDGADLCVGLW